MTKKTLKDRVLLPKSPPRDTRAGPGLPLQEQLSPVCRFSSFLPAIRLVLSRYPKIFVSGLACVIYLAGIGTSDPLSAVLNLAVPPPEPHENLPGLAAFGEVQAWYRAYAVPEDFEIGVLPNGYVVGRAVLHNESDLE